MTDPARCTCPSLSCPLPAAFTCPSLILTDNCDTRVRFLAVHKIPSSEISKFFLQIFNSALLCVQYAHYILLLYSNSNNNRNLSKELTVATSKGERERERRNRYLKRLQLHSVGLSAAHSTLLPVKSGLFKKSQLRGMFKIACNGNSGFFINLCQAKMSVSGRKRRGRLPGYKLGNRFFLLCVHLDLRDYKCSDYQIWNKTSYYNLEACTCTYV